MKPLDLAVDLMLVPPPNKKPRLSPKKILPPVGSYVRLNRLRNTFDKESSGGWTEEVFKVVRHKIHSTNIPMLWVEDLLGEPIRGAYYPLECQEVRWDGVRKVNSILKTRKRKGHPTEYLISYYGWPRKFNEWTFVKPWLTCSFLVFLTIFGLICLSIHVMWQMKPTQRILAVDHEWDTDTFHWPSQNRHSLGRKHSAQSEFY